MGRPIELGLRLGWYILKNKLKLRKRFPLVTMLEPLESCNLTCEGCGRIREYEHLMHRVMSVEECIRAVEESGAPVISVAGGEPTMYPKLSQLVNELVKRRKFVYCCTNGLLMERHFERIKPSKYFCWVVHLDGMEENHDKSVSRKGVWKVAMRATENALKNGYRVCSNSTIFKGSDIGDLHSLFQTLTEMGIEGIMVSPGYDYKAVPNQDVFLSRRESIGVFSQILNKERTKRFRFYNNPLYLEFLRGEKTYQCTAWSNPTYTVAGWRKPCYPLADGHTSNFSELFEGALWDKYGPGNDPRCSNCMMHCGFESATIFGALGNPLQFAKLVKGVATQKSGVGAS